MHCQPTIGSGLLSGRLVYHQSLFISGTIDSWLYTILCRFSVEKNLTQKRRRMRCRGGGATVSLCCTSFFLKILQKLTGKGLLGFKKGIFNGFLQISYLNFAVIFNKIGKKRSIF